MTSPSQIAAIGQEIAIMWADGTESYISMEKLRASSPSAENTGERDLTGRLFAKPQKSDGKGVTVTSWEMVGGYAVQFRFSDGHNTGIFPYDYLRKLGEVG